MFPVQFLRLPILDEHCQISSGGFLQDTLPIIAAGLDKLLVLSCKREFSGVVGIEITLQAAAQTEVIIHVQDQEGYSPDREFTTRVHLADSFPKKITLPVTTVLAHWEFVSSSAQVKIVDISALLVLGITSIETLRTADKLESEFVTSGGAAQKATTSGYSVGVTRPCKLRHRFLHQLRTYEHAQLSIHTLEGSGTVAFHRRTFAFRGAWQFLLSPGDLTSATFFTLNSGNYLIDWSRLKNHSIDYRATTIPIVWNVQEAHSEGFDS